MKEWEKTINAVEDGLFKASEALKGGQGSPIQNAVIDWTNKINEKLHKNLDKGKHNTTSKLYQAAQFKITGKGTVITINLEMPKYGQYLDTGTRPGPRKGLYKTLVKWAETKAGAGGLSGVSNYKSFAYFVAKKIEREGTKPTKWFSSVYNQESVEILKDNLAKEGVKLITNAFK